MLKINCLLLNIVSRIVCVILYLLKSIFKLLLIYEQLLTNSTSLKVN